MSNITVGSFTPLTLFSSLPKTPPQTAAQVIVPRIVPSPVDLADVSAKNAESESEHHLQMRNARLNYVAKTQVNDREYSDKQLQEAFMTYCSIHFSRFRARSKLLYKTAARTAGF
jgi:hypothetical protein